MADGINFVGKLHEQVSAVAPIDGVCVGDPDDKSTWAVVFKEEATSEQRAQAQAVIAAFDADAAEQESAALEQELALAEALAEFRFAWENGLDRAAANHEEKAHSIGEALGLSAWDVVRRVRDIRLYSSDWTQGNDSPLEGQQKQAWKDYRQALRDLPQTYANPQDVVWPDRPDAD